MHSRCRSILLAVMAVLLAGPSWAKEHYVNTVQDRLGNALPGTQITVYEAGTSILAELFSSNDGGAKSNPFVNNANGSYDFFAENGVYDIRFSRSGSDFSTENATHSRIALFDLFDSEIAGLPTSWPQTVSGEALTNEATQLKVRGTGLLSTSGWNIYQHSNGKPVIVCVNDGVEGDCNTEVVIDDGNYWALYDHSANLVLKFEPGASGMKGKYLFGALYRPIKTVYFDASGLNVDGTNCVAPTEQTLNSAPKQWAFSCGDSTSSIFGSKLRMPSAWDGGPLRFTLTLFHGTTETITFAGDFSANCRGAGDTINNTFGTAVQADVAITTANLIAEATSAAVTPNGTCAGGQFVNWRYVIDSANFSTNAANAKILSVSMQYSVTSLSDDLE